MKDRMQCKDIPDATFLAAVAFTPAVGGTAVGWRMRWNVKATLETVMPALPEKLFLAKAKQLINRGLLHGCGCGCRGDYHLPDDRPYCC